MPRLYRVPFPITKTSCRFDRPPAYQWNQASVSVHNIAKPYHNFPDRCGNSRSGVGYMGHKDE